MNIISVDLPWNPGKRGRRALAIADLDRNIKIMLANDDDELLELVRDNIKQESIVLLDIPIEGCDNLEGKHFRPVDKALAHFVSILPTSKAKDRGKGLKELLEKNNKRVKVQEIYPYAIYKFLAYLEKRGMLRRVNSESCQALLDASFRKYVPPKYKREREKDKRLKNMKYLHSLLMDSSLGLKFSTPPYYPDTSSNLNKLSDEYDACLGAIVGIYFANNSCYACVAGDSESGEILLLADQWLQAQLKKEVKVKNLK